MADKTYGKELAFNTGATMQKAGSVDAALSAANLLRGSHVDVIVKEPTPKAGYYQALMDALKHAQPGVLQAPETVSQLARMTKAATPVNDLKSHNKDVLSIGDHLTLPETPYPSSNSVNMIKPGDRLTLPSSWPADFRQTLGKLGEHPTFEQLSSAYPALKDGVQKQYEKADKMRMNPPEGSVPHAWQIDDLYAPAYQTGKEIGKNPGKLSRDDARRVQPLLEDYTAGKSIDVKDLERLSSLDPRVKQAKDKIDDLLKGEYKDVYDAYRTKYVPFVAQWGAERDKAVAMGRQVDTSIIGASQVPADKKAEWVGMHTGIAELRFNHVP